ncbi:hypothetical protein E3N88_29385 [Mikania micrantha]|uniref:Uncharacterized protein n=1 Tax=Mikania micrantha TaxID=192012 RepID=A0A5N6MJD5_9ASTR|nr:hypothetical protein E3N88_29385 [Mikania micrantha]
MVNVGENHARNGVTDCPESRNEDKVEKWKNLATLPNPRGYHCEVRKEGKEEKLVECAKAHVSSMSPLLLF